MSLVVERTSFFTIDFEKQFTWYLDRAGAQVAWRFQAALDNSLRKISNQPDLGQPRHFAIPNYSNYALIRSNAPSTRCSCSIGSRLTHCNLSVSCMVLVTCLDD